MIIEDYVSFETAKLLKEKGFNEKCEYCYAYFDDNNIRVFELRPNKNAQNLAENRYPYVTHQMAMKWLREVHKIQICVEQNPYDAWHYWGFSMSYIDEKINELPNPTQAFIHICPTKLPNNCYKTYEQAVEAALKYSLENLI